MTGTNFLSFVANLQLFLKVWISLSRVHCIAYCCVYALTFLMSRSLEFSWLSLSDVPNSPLFLETEWFQKSHFIPDKVAVRLLSQQCVYLRWGSSCQDEECRLQYLPIRSFIFSTWLLNQVLAKQIFFLSVLKENFVS